ncbi:MAG TPA: hypothetical protein VLT58_07525 [Polyangia bacterium]|nr:hypothetical protein [Polyangia bacterium]
MRSVVTGLMMLAGAAVREKGHGFDDFGWRREVQEAREAQEADAATAETATGDGHRTTTQVVAGPPIGTWGPSHGALMSVTASEVEAAPGDWDVACEREAGDRLVFDRESVRELGGETLFRWAPTGGEVPSGDDTIYTALADCRGKTIEASWPGKRTETRAGTCGRHLIEAVCGGRASEKAPSAPGLRKASGGGVRAGRAKAGASHVSATP